jgi:hypothetical protein
MQPTQLLAVKRLSMTKTDSQTERPDGRDPGDVPFLGWSRAAHEFRVKAAAMAPQGLRPLIIGDPGVGKRTMAKAWRRVAGRDQREWPIIDLDARRRAMPDRCIAVTTRRPPSGRPCFRLESGTWGDAPPRPPGEPTLPADLMQRFAIPLYVPPLQGQREIDILACLGYWTRGPGNSRRVLFGAIDATLVLHLLFDNDWPANLEGVSQALRHFSRLIFHAERGRQAGPLAKYQIDCLRDCWSERGWIAPPTPRPTGPTAAWPVTWLWRGADIPVGAMADFAVRLYLWACWLAPPGPAATSPRGPDPRPLRGAHGLGGPGPTLTAVQFRGLSPEAFVREVVLPGARTGPHDREGEAARLLDLVVSGSILGTNVPALQAGLAINPGAADPPGRVSSAAPPPHRFVVAGDSYALEFHGPQGVEQGTFPRDRYLGLFYFRLLLGCRGEAAGLDPVTLEHRARQGAPPQGSWPGDVSAGEGFMTQPTHQPVLDDQAKAEYQEKLKDYQIELYRAERNQDWAEMQRLENEYRFIMSELKESVHGQHAKDLDKAAKKARDRVRKAMEDARQRLAVKQLPQLAKHLKEVMIYRDGRWSYRPPRPEREWQT